MKSSMFGKGWVRVSGRAGTWLVILKFSSFAPPASGAYGIRPPDPSLAPSSKANPGVTLAIALTLTLAMTPPRVGSSRLVTYDRVRFRDRAALRGRFRARGAIRARVKHMISLVGMSRDEHDEHRIDYARFRG